MRIYNSRKAKSTLGKYEEFMLFTYPGLPHVRMWRKLVSYFHQTRNIIRWIPVIWQDRYWDWCFLFKIMEFKLRTDSKKYNKWGNHVNSDKEAKRMLVCAELLKRMTDNNYKRSEIGEQSLLKYDDYMRDQDLEYLLKIMKKHVFSWWD
jgi:hypothetical protein